MHSYSPGYIAFPKDLKVPREFIRLISEILNVILVSVYSIIIKQLLSFLIIVFCELFESLHLMHSIL